MERLLLSYSIHSIDRMYEVPQQYHLAHHASKVDSSARQSQQLTEPRLKVPLPLMTPRNPLLPFLERAKCMSIPFSIFPLTNLSIHDTESCSVSLFTNRLVLLLRWILTMRRGDTSLVYDLCKHATTQIREAANLIPHTLVRWHCIRTDSASRPRDCHPGQASMWSIFRKHDSSTHSTRGTVLFQ